MKATSALCARRVSQCGCRANEMTLKCIERNVLTVRKSETSAAEHNLDQNAAQCFVGGGGNVGKKLILLLWCKNASCGFI